MEINSQEKYGKFHIVEYIPLVGNMPWEGIYLPIIWLLVSIAIP